MSVFRAVLGKKLSVQNPKSWVLPWSSVAKLRPEDRSSGLSEFPIPVASGFIITAKILSLSTVKIHLDSMFYQHSYLYVYT